MTMISWIGVLFIKAYVCTPVASLHPPPPTEQTTSTTNNCSYWSGGKTTLWAVMGQSDRDVCVHAVRLTPARPKSVFTCQRMEVPGDPSFLKRRGSGWHSVAWRLCSLQPGADLGQAVANARCHARNAARWGRKALSSRLKTRVRKKDDTSSVHFQVERLFCAACSGGKMQERGLCMLQNASNAG